MNKLSDALFTETQQNVLGLLYGNTERSFYTNEILRRTGMGVATIRRELDRMRDAGILTMTPIGNQHHYQANHNCPIFEELSAIVKKTIGIAEIIRVALSPMAARIDCAFVFGSVASGKESSGSDIDLMVIGSAGFQEVVTALFSLQQELGREINPKVVSPGEWAALQKSQSAFYRDVINKPRMDVMGQNYESGEPGWNQS